jgi:hypothetical protein
MKKKRAIETKRLFFKSGRRVIYERNVNNKNSVKEKLDISVRFHILMWQAYLKFSSEA